MLTMNVRNRLNINYGIRDIPNDLLVYFVNKYRRGLDNTNTPNIPETVALKVATTWKRGLETRV